MHALFDTLPPAASQPIRLAPLEGWRPFAAQGADAAAFLHGQLTNDVEGLNAENSRWTGYCTAKGRLLATLLIWRGAPEADAAADAVAAPIYGMMRADLFEPVLKRLSMFILRAKCKLLPVDLNLAGVSLNPDALASASQAAGGALPTAAWARTDLPSGTWIAAPSATAEHRYWWISTPEQLASAGAPLFALAGRADTDAWLGADLAAGLPWIAAATQDVFIPQTVNLDLIDGVSFTKGCYPGQEVVARSHYRGTVKRRMAFGTISASEAPSASTLPGTDIYDASAPNEPCGRVVDAAGTATLSLLFETTLASLPAGDLRLNAPDGPQITLVDLPYALVA
jgi:folate-binding protein YgfZ